MTEIKVEEITPEVKKAYEEEVNAPTWDKRPGLLFLGPPGIGKSMAVREAARKIAEDQGKVFKEFDGMNTGEILDNPDKYFVFIDFRLYTKEPVDVTGYPHKVETEHGTYATYLPFAWTRVFSECPGIVFLDELTNVNRPDKKSVGYQLTLDKAAGFTKFHKGVLVAAAGNKPEHSTVANMLPTPLAGRYSIYDVRKPTIDGWADWMEEHYETWDTTVYAYLKKFSQDFMKVPNDPETLEAYPCPRNWTWTATSERDASALLGDQVGVKYKEFSRTEIPDFSTLVRYPEKFEQMKIEGKYIACTMIGSKLGQNPDKVNRATDLLEKISELRAEYVVLVLLSAHKQKYKILANVSKTSKEVYETLKKVGEFKMEVE